MLNSWQDTGSVTRESTGSFVTKEELHATHRGDPLQIE
jgi:hypothetical protein